MMMRFVSGRSQRPRFIKLSYFAWMVVPLGLWLANDAVGVPHAIWSYSWIDQGQGMNAFAKRYYTRCTFVGPYGHFTEAAQHGKCAWIMFVKAEPN